jgi:2',3'-cyclic-nucleotide 2'-phosphodiesterase (5'-nucleotidase family)
MRGIATGTLPGRRILSVIVAAVLVAGLMLTAAAPEADARRDNSNRVSYWLTVLHNNDGESRLIDAGGDLTEFGGVARFATKVDELRRDANKLKQQGKKASVLISSGDNFLAGPELNASFVNNEATGEPYYDSIALSMIGYDAMTIGNHEFDFGPDVLAEFIDGFGGETPFISSNLDFSGEPRLQALEDDGVIAGSVITKKKGEEIGIVGATTELLPTISSPRNVEVEAVLPAVQAEVAALKAEGVDKIILSSHLQGINSEIELVESLTDVDVVIAGGGDELLVNGNELLVPGDDAIPPFGPYPVLAEDAAGNSVPVVTTPGNYKYVGKLTVGFNSDGEVLKVHRFSGLERVAARGQRDGVRPDNKIQKQVVEPVAESIQALAENVIGDSAVTLNGQTSQVRTRETNAGNLIADSLLWQATKSAPDFGVPEPDIALQNGGGIRNDLVVNPGPITELDTFTWLPFSNFTAVVEGVERTTLKAILEHVVTHAPAVAQGKFAQIAGFRYTYDPDLPVGSKVRSATLDDGTVLIQNGSVVAGPALTVATIDFLARGGDGYPFGPVDFTPVGVSYQQALFNYITAPDGLNGQVTAADYPEGGEGRIVPE